MNRDRRTHTLLGVAALAALGGCSSDAPEPTAGPTLTLPPTTTPAPPSRAERRHAPLPRCPAAAPPGCRSAAGRIIYVESVDPDGDGDAHFVLLSRQSITAPGISVIDVARHLRPRPLPNRGDWIAAAGPVYTGSYGQRQVEAIVLDVSR